MYECGSFYSGMYFILLLGICCQNHVKKNPALSKNTYDTVRNTRIDLLISEQSNASHINVNQSVSNEGLSVKNVPRSTRESCSKKSAVNYDQTISSQQEQKGTNAGVGTKAESQKKS